MRLLLIIIKELLAKNHLQPLSCLIGDTGKCRLKYKRCQLLFKNERQIVGDRRNFQIITTFEYRIYGYNSTEDI